MSIDNLGKQLRKHRMDNKLTQEEAASQLGVSTAPIYKWESGQTQPNAENAEKIRKFLGTPATPKRRVNRRTAIVSVGEAVCQASLALELQRTEHAATYIAKQFSLPEDTFIKALTVFLGVVDVNAKPEDLTRVLSRKILSM